MTLILVRKEKTAEYIYTNYRRVMMIRTTTVLMERSIILFSTFCGIQQNLNISEL